ncbi:putative HNHc nuclease [Weissella sagaensis]|uniref:putative HNHc nuclease n=1 Tax=Weissella sagaensis TaxID=2559928 RepID=UPI0013ED020E|nr:putative HNHc nuclease [Weissella sagaensis]
MDLWGRITAIKGNQVVINLENREELANLSLFTKDGQPQVVVEVQDERQLSNLQRKKAYAVMGEIVKYTGYLPEEAKEWMKYLFTAETGHPYFSFSDADMTTAREFITFLLDYAIKHHIPMMHSGLTYQDDLDAYMYQSLKYRSCVICGERADVHHIDTVGMGNDRALVDHRKKDLIALCREHHQEAHQLGWPTFKKKYHVKGIKLNAQTLNQLGIMTYKRMKEIDNDQTRTT